MQEQFRNYPTLLIYILHLVRSNIFSLLEFENILLAVNNSEGNFVGVKLGDVSGLHPPILGDSFVCLFF